MKCSALIHSCARVVNNSVDIFCAAPIPSQPASLSIAVRRLYGALSCCDVRGRFPEAPGSAAVMLGDTKGADFSFC